MFAQYIRSVVGIGVDKIEAKGAEGPIRTEHYLTLWQATTMARIVVAVKKWLGIVGAESDGQTAVAHQHGLYVDFTSNGTVISFKQICLRDMENTYDDLCSKFLWNHPSCLA